MKNNILLAGVLTLFSSSWVMAQEATEKNVVLLGTQRLSVNYADTTCFVPVLTNQALEIKTSADWVSASYNKNRLKVHVQQNFTPLYRNATVEVAAKDGSMSRTFIVEQEREGLSSFAPRDMKVEIASATANLNEPGEGIERTYDGNMSTLWHSPYKGTKFPYILTYNFENVDQIDYLRYYPRNSGGTNGNFDTVAVFVKCADDIEYKKVYTGYWGGKSIPRDVAFTTPLKNPVSIRFEISSGAGGFASCAEMEFYKKREDDPNTSIFEDDSWSSLKAGITQADVDALTNPYCKFVAQELLTNGDAFTKGRVQEYICRLSPEKQSDLLKAPGKYYDHLQGVTGININKGIHGIAVAGLPEGEALTLKVVAWFSQELNEKGKGGYPIEFVYQLHNGINTIEYTSDYDGLAYIAYYSDEYPVDHIKYPNVKVHFINDVVNGYLTPDKKNEDLDIILQNATNRCIDLVGSRVHSIWQTAGLQNYCKAVDGTSKGYVQFMNVLDSLVDWEHHLLGLKKYDRVPDNRTMAYVNYTYYMFQGNYGVSFMYDQESRVLNCKTIMTHDGDAIWGLSHEWGHQHQMQPYFCWSGLGESSNNMNSCENVLRMGYNEEKIYEDGNMDGAAKRIRNAWNTVYEHQILAKDSIEEREYGEFVGEGLGDYNKKGDSGNFDNDFTYVGKNNGAYIKGHPHIGEGMTSEPRIRAYQGATTGIGDSKEKHFAWNEEIRQMAISQYEDLCKVSSDGYCRIPAISKDPLKGMSTSEMYVEANTAAYYMLHNYFSFMAKGTKDYKPDYQLDLYEALRQNDEVNGSTVEPGKTKVDKYELLASAQNGNAANKYKQFVTDYPNSVWVKNGYIREGAKWTENSVPFIFNYIRKASQICGYNLFHYFDKMGFLRTIVMVIDDYGYKDYALTKAMRDEFEQDMLDLGLPMLDDEMIEKITHAKLPIYDMPEIPNVPVIK